MKATGFISSAVAEKITKTTGKKFYTFRLAENFGSGAKRSTTWYEILAHIPEEEASKLHNGLLVEVTGKIEAMPYLNKDKTACASLRIIAFDVIAIAPSSSKSE